jgi:hypothetical protein
MTTDLTQPLIIATVPVLGGPPAALLIDGYALPVTVRVLLAFPAAPADLVDEVDERIRQRSPGLCFLSPGLMPWVSLPCLSLRSRVVR